MRLACTRVYKQKQKWRHETLRLSWKSIMRRVFGEKEVTWRTLNTFSVWRTGKILDNVSPVMLCLSVLSACLCCLSVCLRSLSRFYHKPKHADTFTATAQHAAAWSLNAQCWRSLNIKYFTFCPQTVVTWFVKQPFYPTKAVPNLFSS